jgi:hypothetical protein
MIRQLRVTRTNALAVAAALFVLASGASLAAPPEEKKSRADDEPAGASQEPKKLSRTIDKYIEQRLQAEKVTASPRADDAAFLRRAYLDITGRIPTAEKAAAFLDNHDPAKRAKLIDELLASKEYGTHQADIWQALLMPRNSDNRRVQFDPMVKWLEESFNADKPWDKIVHEILTASGEQDKEPAVTYFLANATVDKMTDSVTKLFLGVQLQCAQCHNHPFTEWKQTEYWGMAAFFMKTQVQPPRPNAQNAAPPKVLDTPNPRRGRNALPDSAKVVPAKFLAGEQPQVDAKEPLRPVLADWVTKADNPYFSKAMVNRVWSQFFGRGLVNPVDDMHDGNPASHPELLEEMARQFAASGFDVKYLIRAVCNSQAYQRSSKPAGGNADASPAVLARMPIKVLSPEQLFDSLVQALGAPARPNNNGGRPTANAPRPAVRSPRAAFVAFFGLEDGADPTEYQAGIPQALRLMNSPQLNNNAVLNQYLKGDRKPNEVVEHLCLMTLSRRPTGHEYERLTTYVRNHKGEPRQAYSDILWALLNSSEFTMNH